MNDRQAMVIHLLRADERRDLYEGAAPSGVGCGQFFVSFSYGVKYEPLSTPEVLELEQEKLITKKWPPFNGCYALATGAPA